MRIALLSWESLHSIAVGGLAAHVSELAAALSRRGHEVHLFTDGRQSDAVRLHRRRALSPLPVRSKLRFRDLRGSDVRQHRVACRGDGGAWGDRSTLCTGMIG